MDNGAEIIETLNVILAKMALTERMTRRSASDAAEMKGSLLLCRPTWGP